MGFTLGPALAGLLGAGDGYTGPIVAALVVSAIGLLLCLRLRDSERCPEGPPPTAGSVSRVLGQEHRRCDRSERPASSGVLRRPAVRLVLLATFLMFLAFNLYYASFPIHATSGLRWSTGEMGLFYSLMSVAMFVVQGPGLAQATKRLRPSRVFGLGLLGLVLAFSSFPVMSDIAAFAGGLLFALGNGLAWATFQARAASLVPESEQGSVQGSISSVSALASIVGLVAGGVVYPALQGQTFVLSAVLFGVVLLMTPLLFRDSGEEGWEGDL